jgi:hypothetical protein
VNISFNRLQIDSLTSSTERLPSRQPRGATAHGEATAVKLGGFSAPTQDVSGARPTYALVSGLVATLVSGLVPTNAGNQHH